MKTAIHPKTKAEFKKVLQIFTKKKWVWSSGDKPLDYINYWNDDKEETCIEYGNNFSYSRKGWYEENGYKIISFEEFLEMEGLVKLSEEQIRQEMILNFQESK